MNLNKLIKNVAIISSFLLVSLSTYGQSKRIRMLTYNIKHGAEVNFDLNKIVKALKASKADVIALQEVDKNRPRSKYVDQTKYIAEKLRMNYTFKAAMKYSNGKEEYGNAILSRFPITKVRSIKLPKGTHGRAGYKEDRVALVATISPYKDKPKHDFTFISTHFAVYNYDSRVKGESGILLNKFINKKDYFSKPAFLAGDLNEKFTVLKTRTKNWDRSAFSIQNLKHKWGFNSKKIKTAPGKQIDYVLARTRGYYKIIRYEEQKHWRHVSDHTFLLLEVEANFNKK